MINAAPLTIVRSKCLGPHRFKSASVSGESGSLVGLSKMSFTGFIIINVIGITEINSREPANQRISELEYHATSPVKKPVTASAICIGAARLYMGGKKRPPTETPAFRAAGC